MGKMIDISVDLSEDTIIYPGDPKPEIGLMFRLKEGDIANVGYMKTGLHHGTHVDVPFHFKDGEKKFHEMTMSHWVGRVYVADITSAEECVKASNLKDIPVEDYDRILFKTKNSEVYYKESEFNGDFIYLEKSACERLVEAGVKTVGLDYITVDPHGSEDFPAHNTLLLNGTCIIECINLEEVEAGEYYLMCLPLKLVGTDASPARAMLIEKGFSL